jgi:hypothetical protein
METTRRSDGTNPHTVTFILESDTITSKFNCAAAPTADCHFYRDCDCGYACEDHAPVRHDECWMQSWFDSLMAVEELHSLEQPFTLAAVPISWETQYDDGFTWSVDREPPGESHPVLFEGEVPG